MDIKCRNCKVVYLLLNKDTGYIKVGITKDINKRRRTLELQSGSSLTLIYITDQLNRYRTIEHSFKQFYKKQQQEGEWFSISVDEAKNTLQFILQNLERNPLPL
jgi:predicted GIY-YIG superfamily endonuclease